MTASHSPANDLDKVAEAYGLDAAAFQSLADDAPVKEALKWLDSCQDEMLQTVMDWSRVNSGSRNLAGLAAMEDLILGHINRLSADCNPIQLDPTERVSPSGVVEHLENGRSLLIKGHGRGNRKVLMTGHTDTVFPVDSDFQTPVWSPDGTLNGPGVTDMKGGILVMFYALEAMERAGLADRISYEVLLSPDEETGSLASAPLLAAAAKRADIGLTYEPALADGTLVGRRKGSGNYTIVVAGRAAHAGRAFHEGRNAIVKCAAIITELAALTDGRKGLTCNPALITGGQAPNVVPDHAQIGFNVRLEKPDDAFWFEEQVAAIVARHGADDGFDVTLHGGISRPPKVITKAGQALMDRIAACGALLGLDIRYVATGGVCEGNNLAASGLPNVDTLGVRGGLIHSDQEFLVVESLAERAKLSLMILAAFAHGLLDEVVTAKREEAAAKT